MSVYFAYFGSLKARKLIFYFVYSAFVKKVKIGIVFAYFALLKTRNELSTLPTLPSKISLYLAYFALLKTCKNKSLLCLLWSINLIIYFVYFAFVK